MPPRSYRDLRPLTDEEIDRCRSFAERMKGETRYAVAWALAEATARVAELGAIRASDLELEECRVWIGGSSSTDARWSTLTDWGVDQLQRVVMSRLKPPPDRSLLMPETTSRASVHEFVASTLRQASLAKTPGVRPNSIPAWRGAAELANGASIDQSPCCSGCAASIGPPPSSGSIGGLRYEREASLEKVEAILHNPAIYELARAIPGPARSGRRRDYPTFMILVFNSLLSVWRSGRQVEAELSHPLVWRHMRRIVRRRFPHDASMHLPAQPMRRHHYVYGRDQNPTRSTPPAFLCHGPF